MDPLQENGAAQPARQRLPQQALWFLLHTLLALATWIGLMLLGYALHPVGVPQWAILALSTMVPLLAGLIAVKIRRDEIATTVWLVGLIWMLMLSLWLLDQPTGRGECMGCSATEKMARTFLSWPEPSGLIDDDGPFLGTWPAAALVGYSVGAWLGMRGRG